jgi:hypothetical protein
MVMLPRAARIAAKYERAFVRTVLLLNSSDGTFSVEQTGRARQTYARYRVAVAARTRNLALDGGWLQDRMPEQAAVERASLFTRFGSLVEATAGQGPALCTWLACRGKLVHGP